MAITRSVRKKKQETMVTIGEAYGNFEIIKKAKGLVEATLHNYEQSLNYFLDYCGFDDDTDIKEINRDLVINWTIYMQNKGLSTKAINHYLGDIRAFVRWCADDERKYLPLFKVQLVSAQEPSKKIFSQADIKRLLEKPKRKNDVDFVEWRNWTIVNLIVDMGARAGTVIDIRVGDIDLKRHTIYLRHTKNKALAHMSLSSHCAKILKEFIEDWRGIDNPEDFLFCNMAGEQLTYNAFAHSFAKYCKNRGVEQHNIHGLRHYFATALAENTNGDMVRVQKALGHSSIDMAKQYVDLATVSMGNYDDISPLERAKDKKGRPSRAIRKNSDK